VRIDLGVVATLFRTELKSALRDRRTVLLSILLPALATPLLLYLSRQGEARQEAKLEASTHAYAVSGEDADLARALIAEGLASGTADGRFREVISEDPGRDLDDRAIEVWVEGQPGEGSPPAVPKLVLNHRGDREESIHAMRKLEGAIRSALEARQQAVLAARGAAVSWADVLPEEVSDLAPEAGTSGLTFGRVLTILIVFLILSGGAVVAVDALAGEKERGTLETLLTSAAGRLEVVAAKLLLILFVALAITLIQFLNLAVWGGLELFDLPNDLLDALTPGRLLVLFVLFLPVAALLSAVLLYISGRARTYREAQTLLLPLFLAAVAPPAAALLPGIELRSAIVLVPVANLSVGVMELMAGRPDWPMLALAFLVNAATAAWVTRLAARTLTGERLMAEGQRDAAEALGGPALFPRRVLLWFAIFWVLQFVVAVNVESLASLKRQVLFNVVLIFGGGAFFLIRRYRLDPSEALSLRAPPPAAWIAVLLGAPAGLLTGIGVFRLASLVLPVPESVLNAFSEMFAPAELQPWEIVLFLCVLPGVFEEIAFRGVLTYGLSKRLRPLPLVLAVGLIFGLFHSVLFRIAPTAFLGVLLTGVVVLTGSIFPAMLWHALNNALGLWTSREGADLADLPAGYYAAAAAVLALVFWILWRARPPGLPLGRSRRPMAPPARKPD